MEQPNRVVLRVRQTAERCGCSVATIWRKAKNDPQFPKPVRVSERVTGWLEHEINAYLNGRADARGGKA